MAINKNCLLIFKGGLMSEKKCSFIEFCDMPAQCTEDMESWCSVAQKWQNAKNENCPIIRQMMESEENEHYQNLKPDCDVPEYRSMLPDHISCHQAGKCIPGEINIAHKLDKRRFSGEISNHQIRLIIIQNCK
jgi:hypothetical protein